MLSCVTPVPNTDILNVNTIEKINKEELWSKEDRILRGLKQELLKTTLPMIKESEADFFIFDLYNFHTNLLIYDNTMFSPWSYEFFNTEIYKKNPAAFSTVLFPLDLPLGIWWGYVKNFFDIVFEKYGNEKVIMLRLTACSHYVGKDKKVYEIPELCKKPWKANDKYNKHLRALEERIIKEYNPHVIDFSKYYMGDSGLSEDIQGAHFSVGYYKESFKAIKEIIFGAKNRGQDETILHYTKLSFAGIAKILKKDIPQEEFKKMWGHIDSPIKELNDCGILKRIALLPDDIIVSNRFFISEICDLAEAMAYIWENPLFSDEERNYLLLRRIESHKGGSFIQSNFAFWATIFKQDEGALNLLKTPYASGESFFQKFKILFENDNLAWIEYLKAAEKCNPESIEILRYMKFYAVAMEDWAMADEYEKRIEQQVISNR